MEVKIKLELVCVSSKDDKVLVFIHIANEDAECELFDRKKILNTLNESKTLKLTAVTVDEEVKDRTTLYNKVAMCFYNQLQKYIEKE